MEMQTPALLVRRDILSESLVPELIHSTLRDKTHLAHAIRQKTGVDLARHRSVLMRDRLVELFKWKKGRVAFSEGTVAREPKPFANSLLHLLFDGVHRNWTQADLKNRLRNLLERKWIPSESMNDVLGHMDLNEGQWTAAQRISEGRPVSHIIKKTPAETMITLVMFYLLTEMGLLVEKRS
jgi:hypothetical protein